MTNSILIITRNYPPRIGGLETFSYELIRQFQLHDSCRKITFSKSKPHLLWFLPYCLILAVRMTRRHSIPHVHLCDGLLAPVGVVLKWITGAKITITIHGLDITYHNRVYQKIFPGCIGKLDRVFCPSRSTASKCREKGISQEKITVVPNGIRPESVKTELSTSECRWKMEQRIGISLSGKQVMISLGRLVKRKGISWFVENVMPRLCEQYIYVVAGDGPERKTIERAVRDLHLEKRVFIVGWVSDAVRNVLYKASDLFVMPNIFVEHDMEGFGIVAIEAGAAGLPVVGTDLQGIRDAVIQNETGCLVNEKDVRGFLNAIAEMKLEKKKVASVVKEKYSWRNTYEKYRKGIFLLDA